ncbi:Hsp70 family protein [Microlunatus ginsengisoli]|uniref:Hsp70 family protein n=1 Tax=Microlunatus ginsengisoli TaxID=363863 RepID=A0ABP7AQ43_9ACTN
MRSQAPGAAHTSYRLGIDLGTTFTAVGVARHGEYRVMPLGQHRLDIPSTVYVAPDATVTVGDAAETLGHQYPTAVAREFKRRLGDPVPLIVDGRPFSPQTLMAHILRWSVTTATNTMGSRPDLLAVTCPANWGPYKHELLTQVIKLADVPSSIICTEPEAAAIRHAGADARKGALVGIYDLGGGTFDAAILRASGSGGFQLAGPPEGIEHLGGIDFDEAIYSFVLHALGREALDLAGSDDPDVITAMAAVRRRCIAAKETLSTEPAASIEVSLPGQVTTVRITRPEFEAMIKPALGDTLRALTRALRGAAATTEDLTSLVLVGGSVRIPLVAELVARNVESQVVIPRDPSHSVAVGAAIAADRYRIPPASAASRGTPATRRPAPATRSSVPLPGRDALLTARELVRINPGERAHLAEWSITPGTPVHVGQPLAKLIIRAPTGTQPRTGQSRAVLLRSPFAAILHRTFITPGALLTPADLLAGFEQVHSYLDRPGRALPTDTGIRLTLNQPISATANAGRPVAFLDRTPHPLWWSASFCMLTRPGPHLVGTAYTRGNQWFGFASRTITIPTRGLLHLTYTDPGTGATAELQPTPHRGTETAAAGHPT